MAKKSWRLDYEKPQDVKVSDVIVYYDRKVKLRANDLDEAKSYVAGYHQNEPVILVARDGYETDISKEIQKTRAMRIR